MFSQPLSGTSHLQHEAAITKQKDSQGWEDSDLDMFDDDEDIIQLLQMDDNELMRQVKQQIQHSPASVVSESNSEGKLIHQEKQRSQNLPATVIGDSDGANKPSHEMKHQSQKSSTSIVNENESTEEPTHQTEPQSQHSPIATMSDKNSDNEDGMEFSGNISDLPDEPDFSMDELPIYTGQRANQEVETPAPEKSSDKDDDILLDLPDLDFMDEETSEPINNCAEQLKSLDILDLPSIKETLSTPEVTGLENSSASPSPLPSTSKPEEPHLKTSLRSRNPIQLHPFTVEQARFKSLLGESSLKGTINVNYTQAIDTQDTEFTLSNTQMADLPTEEILETPDIPHTTTTSSSTSATASSRRKSSNPTPKAATLDLNLDSLPTLEKYGLGSLILPSSIVNPEAEEDKISKRNKKDKGKGKARVFTKKGSKHKSRIPLESRKRSTSSTKDIFAFDEHPRFSTRLTEVDLPSQSGSGSSRTERQQPEATEVEENTMEDDEMDTDDEEVIHIRRPKKKRNLLLEDSDEDGNENSNPNSDHDNDNEILYDYDDMEADESTSRDEPADIFEFPGGSMTENRGRNRKRLQPHTTEEDLMPVVEDEFEYKERKRHRIGISDVMRAEKVLKSVLPASYAKVYKKQIIEEQMNKKRTAKRAKATVNNTSDLPESSRPTVRSNPENFADFLGSQNQDSSEDEETPVAYSTLDEYVTRSESSERAYAQPLNSSAHQPTPNRRSNSSYRQYPIYTSSARSSGTHSSVLNPTSVKPVSIPLPLSLNRSAKESLEYNRIATLAPRSSSRSNNTNSARRRGAPNASSTSARTRARARAQVSNRLQSNIPFQAGPAHRRRNKPKSKPATDDVYVHSIYSYRIWNDRSGQALIVSEPEFMRHYRRNQRKRMRPTALDDIYVGTQQERRYVNDASDVDHFKDSIGSNWKPPSARHKVPLPIVHNVYTLDFVVKKVCHLGHHDLRRPHNLKSPVYLHHYLLSPILSLNPNERRFYKRFSDTYGNLCLFGKPFSWSCITPMYGAQIDHLFCKVAWDIKHLVNDRTGLEEEDDLAELSGHDHFYTFVSVCLSSWIPCMPKRLCEQMVEIFMRQIRGLAHLISDFINQDTLRLLLPWRPIMKLMIYMLDWACRLDTLGMCRADWSVAEHAQLMLDALVINGYKDIRSGKREYLSEAWICLLKVMAISTASGSYHFDETVFIEQTKDSIRRKAPASGAYEFERRRTIRLWSEELYHLFENHFL